MIAFTPISPRRFFSFGSGGLPKAETAPIRVRLAGWLAERRRRAQLAHELSLLNERDLTDLGIGRGDFPAIIGGTYRRSAD